jgi:hypothetical protein
MKTEFTYLPLYPSIIKSEAMKQKWLYNWYLWQFNWQQYQSILFYSYREDELERLVVWAKRKQLGVSHYYKSLRYETEATFETRSIRYPKLPMI